MEEMVKTVERICGTAIALLVIIPIFSRLLGLSPMALFEGVGVDMLRASVVR